MLRIFVLALCALGALGAAAAGQPHRRFDGSWMTTLSCPNTNGALGYSFEFPARVKDDRLHAEKGTKGEPGWLQIEGTVLEDGAADLYASGLVGAAAYAVGARPAGTAYGYHIEAHFFAAAGSGHRLEGRPCSISFVKKD